ncbi:MAG: hypothetical protein ABIK31_01605 [candidate division WOR-3 bacterium]
MKTLILLTVLTFPLTILGQEEKSEKKFKDNFSASVDITTSGQFVNYSKLNATINQFDFGNFSNTNLALGLNAGLWLYNSGFLGVEWNYISNTKNPTNRNGQTIYLDGKRVLIMTGYKFYGTDKINLSGFLGYGGNILSLTTKNDISFNNFNSSLTSLTAGSTDLINEIIEFTIGGDYLFRPKDMDCEKRKLRIGLRTGYQYALNNRWQSGTNEIQGPSVNNNGFIVKLIFGQIQN